MKFLPGVHALHQGLLKLVSEAFYLAVQSSSQLPAQRQPQEEHRVEKLRKGRLQKLKQKVHGCLQGTSGGWQTC